MDKCLIPILKAEYKNWSSIALRLLKQKSNEITNAEFIPSACHICNTDVMGLTNYASIRLHCLIKELKTELWSNGPRCSVRLLLKQNSRSLERKHRSPERLFRTIEPKVRKPSRNFRTLKRKSRTSEPKARKPSRNFRSLERKTRTLEHFVWTCKFKVNIVKEKRLKLVGIVCP